MSAARSQGPAAWNSVPVAGWIVVATTTVLLLRAAVEPLWDADFWWILRTGQLVLEEGAMPRANRYSFTDPGHPWLMHEWLFGIVYAGLVRVLGLPGVALARVVLALVTLAALLARTLRDVRRPVLGALAVAVALAVFGDRFGSPRPLGMSYAFAAVAAALAFEPAFGTRHAVALAAVQLVWANAHGSFPLGLVIAALGLAVPGGSMHSRLLGLALALLATLATPHGPALHALVARYLLGATDDPVQIVHARILEWWPLWRAPLRVARPEALGIAATVAGVSVLALRDPRWRPRGLLGLLLAAAAVRHGRHLQFLGLLGVPLLVGCVEEHLWREHPESSRPTPRRVVLWVLPGLALALVSWALAVRARRDGDWTNPTREDEAFVALASSLPDGSRLYTELMHSGYAVYVGFPRVRVFFDPRNDCYSPDVLRAGLDINDGRVTPEVATTLLVRHGTSHALVRAQGRAAGLLRAMPAVWRARDQRGGLALFERRR